ncbi:MAG: hypothetical protein KDD53_09920, partial [Bdellovibrionales bacterium]|nr:hypothetical protein [Bdellovibrionales bacterium]
MGNPLKYPKLRWPIELRIESTGDQRFLLIRDPVGITRDPLLLVPDVAPIIATFEGALSVEDIVK